MFGLDVKAIMKTLIGSYNNYQSELKSIFSKREIDFYFKILLDYFFKWDATFLGLNPNHELKINQQALLKEALLKLKEQQPIQQIVQQAHFRNLQIKVNRSVLIPRPETEELIDWILEDYASITKSKKVLDVGTGSGCVAISLALENKNFNLEALDVSHEALETARENAKNCGLDIHFYQHNILKDELKISFDLIVSNPPYLSPHEKEYMETKVLQYEPHLALFTPLDDPLIFYRAILNHSTKYLKPKGRIYFEINPIFFEELITLIKTYALFIISIRKDIFGKKRILRLIKK